jgi:bifunctional non-homologous end joining protein LigD
MANSVPDVTWPAHVPPMLATLARELPVDPEPWTFEIKWDGIRAIAFCDGGAVRLESRNLRDITVSWPELAGLGDALGGRRVVLDGEIVALDDRGLPSFQRLQERMHVANPEVARRKSAEVPVSYLVFDVLNVDGDDLMPLPWHERRAALIAKRVESTYVPGGRSKSWLKVKVSQSDEFLVAGWQPGEGRRAERIGSLLLGVPTADGGLHHVGNVGTGFTDAELGRLADRLGPLRRDTSPFTGGSTPKRGSVFVEPEVVVEVHFAERTSDGILRHPVYKGLRVDKGPSDVNTVEDG